MSSDYLDKIKENMSAKKLVNRMEAFSHIANTLRTTSAAAVGPIVEEGAEPGRTRRQNVFVDWSRSQSQEVRMKKKRAKIRSDKKTHGGPRLVEEKHIIYKPCGKCGRKQNRRQLLCVHCLGTDMTREIMVGEKVTHSSDGTRIMTDEEVDDFLKPMVGESVRDLVQGSRQKNFKGMKGYLEKRGEGAAVDTWNKRWVMAGDNGRLQYYEDEMDLINGKQPLQMVNIKKVKVHDFLLDIHRS